VERLDSVETLHYDFSMDKYSASIVFGMAAALAIEATLGKGQPHPHQEVVYFSGLDGPTMTMASSASASWSMRCMTGA